MSAGARLRLLDGRPHSAGARPALRSALVAAREEVDDLHKPVISNRPSLQLRTVGGKTGPRTAREASAGGHPGDVIAIPARVGSTYSYGRGERSGGFAFQLSYVIAPAAGVLVEVA